MAPGGSDKAGGSHPGLATAPTDMAVMNGWWMQPCTGVDPISGRMHDRGYRPAWPSKVAFIKNLIRSRSLPKAGGLRPSRGGPEAEGTVRASEVRMCTTFVHSSVHTRRRQVPLAKNKICARSLPKQAVFQGRPESSKTAEMAEAVHNREPNFGSVHTARGDADAGRCWPWRRIRPQQPARIPESAKLEREAELVMAAAAALHRGPVGSVQRPIRDQAQLVGWQGKARSRAAPRYARGVLAWRLSQLRYSLPATVQGLTGTRLCDLSGEQSSNGTTRRPILPGLDH